MAAKKTKKRTLQGRSSNKIVGGGQFVEKMLAIMVGQCNNI